MKTLDEVIKALELCSTDDNPCDKCPYTEFDKSGEWACSMCGDFAYDALHYLKVLQKMQKAEPLEKSEWSELYNQPLTWSELRQMEGKPVWIDSVPLVRRWVIIKKFHPIGGNKNLFDMEVEDGAHFLRKNMRRDDPAWWQAYRKER